jgi:small subunit ribosomal protein S16
MLNIRLFRVGKKNQPAYKIVVTDKRNAASRGRFVEEVGFYNPLTKQRNMKGDRVKYWMSVGAKPSDTVHNMLVTDNIIEAKKIPKNKKSKKAAEQSAVEAETVEAEQPTKAAPEEAKEEEKQA